MQSTLDLKIGNPQDVVEIVPDVILVARAERELSRLAQDAARRRTEPKMASDVFAGSSVPPVDTTFRATAVNSQIPGLPPPLARRATRGFMGFLMAVLVALGSGLAPEAWNAYGDTWQAYADVARQMIARWTPPFVPTAAPAVPAQPSAAVSPALVPSPNQTQLLQSMASNLAGVRQEIERLKADTAELKTSQDQLSREAAKLSEQTHQLKVSAVVSPRPATALARRPTPAYRTAQTTTAYVPPPAATPYVPPVVYPSPQAAPDVPPPSAAQPQYDPDAPRPPMPVR